ncbi:MAG: ABC transporter substrate-binding protein [Planctomycetota bacterium]|nr:ABC transporter substrate-binding protein [Planctomycetota bacterium]
MRRFPRLRASHGPGLLVLLGLLGTLRAAPEAAVAAPGKGHVLVVLGTQADGGRLEAAARGAFVATRAAAGKGFFEDGLQVEQIDDGGNEAGLKKALKAVKKAKPIGVVACPTGDMAPFYWKAAKSVRVPWFVATGMAPDEVQNPGNVCIVGPTPVAQGIRAADAMIAPLSGRRVAVVHEPTALGRVLAAAFTRNLSERVALAGVREWDPEDDATDVIGALKGYEPDWVYVAMTGVWAQRFAAALKSTSWTHPCLFCDGSRDESVLEAGGAMLAKSVFLDGPDPELMGRVGEDLVMALERLDGPIETVAIRAYEGARRIVQATAKADSTKLKKVWAALAPGEASNGALGPLHFELHGGIRFFPLTYWKIERGRFEMWPIGLLPVEGCGPPLGFRAVKPAAVNERRGKIGYVTYGDGKTRTIEQDMLEIGLSTGGKHPELDAFVRGEILARAIRIAHRLFRREADGTPIPGHSWGMSFTTTKPDDDVPRSKVWLAIVAGDDEAAGGRVIGSGMVAVYSTFLKRTMYITRKLEPPISDADKHLILGDYRWGMDRANNRRADEIRCLIDGFASAVGLTLSHEFGHLCGCGHDTEHPTSIMNVVAGAGASWEEAVWIPSHQRNVTTALGIEGLRR